MTERALTDEEKTEFATRAAQASKNLGFDENTVAPAAAVQAVNDFVDRWQSERSGALKKLFGRKPGLDSVDVALGLGAVWGDQLVRRFGWEWVCVRHEEQDLYGVVSPDRSVAVYPTYFVKACLDNPQADCTAMLAFNMIEAGNVSGLPPDGYENLMMGVRRIIPKR